MLREEPSLRFNLPTVPLPYLQSDLGSALKELQRLPRARVLPPFLGFKRERSSGALASGAAAAASSRKPQALDPTGLLLVEAANQLKQLVEEANLRRHFLLAHRPGGAWAADSGTSSEADDDCGPVCCDSAAAASSCAAGGLPDPLASCDSFGAADSVERLSLGTSLGGSSSSGGGRAPLKRSRLERQYAIDLDGNCRLVGQRLPLPLPYMAAE